MASLGKPSHPDGTLWRAQDGQGTSDFPAGRWALGPASRCAACGVRLSFLLMSKHCSLPPHPQGSVGLAAPGQSIPGLQELDSKYLF